VGVNDVYPRFDLTQTASRLRESVATVEWAVERIPEEWTHALPDTLPTDSWTVAMNLGHLIVYDELIAMPVLKALADGGDGTNVTFGGRSGSSMPREDWFLNDSRDLSVLPTGELVARLRTARDAQATMVESFSDDQFNARVTPLFGQGKKHSAGWIATKTFQHTWEHGNAILRMALFAPRE
jgi:hypothetical protein